MTGYSERRDAAERGRRAGLAVRRWLAGRFTLPRILAGLSIFGAYVAPDLTHKLLLLILSVLWMILDRMERTNSGGTS